MKKGEEAEEEKAKSPSLLRLYFRLQCDVCSLGGSMPTAGTFSLLNCIVFFFFFAFFLHDFFQHL